MKLNRTGKIVAVIAVVLIGIKLISDYIDHKTFGNAEVGNERSEEYISLFKNIKGGKVFSMFSSHNSERYPYWIFLTEEHNAFEYSVACYKYDCDSTLSLSQTDIFQDAHIDSFFEHKYFRWYGNLNFLYRDRHPSKIRKLTLRSDLAVSPSLVKNDTFAYYYLPLNQLTIGLNNETTGDILIKNPKRINTNIEVAFLKKNDFLYVICCNANGDSSLADPWALARLLGADTSTTSTRPAAAVSL